MLTVIVAEDWRAVRDDLKAGSVHEARLAAVIEHWIFNARPSAAISISLDAEDTKIVRAIADRLEIDWKEAPL